ncbi:MAG: fasciclin domain-containing protein [Kofleriaceae bacterium]
MKRLVVPVVLILMPVAACKQHEASPAPAPAPAPAAPATSLPPLDPTNIASIAMGSKDHTTLVAAVKAADYVPSIANSGPLTVFAPTNAAFEKLPPGTVEALVKPDKQADLREILKYHVTTSVYETKDLKDGMTLGMANGAKVTIHVVDGQVTVNDAKVLTSIRASNGIVHVIDTVLLPPAP